jgi:hypothetical protein
MRFLAHTAVDMLHAQSAMVERLIGPLLLHGQLLATGFLGGHEELDLGQGERQEPQTLQEPAPRWQGIPQGIATFLHYASRLSAGPRYTIEAHGPTFQYFSMAILHLGCIIPSM